MTNAINTDLSIRPSKLRTRHQRKFAENRLVKNSDFTRTEARAHVKKIAATTRTEYRAILLKAVRETATRRDQTLWNNSFTQSNPYRCKEELVAPSIDINKNVDIYQTQDIELEVERQD